ncbi:MAG: STAS domain-containing protein [Candidatus Latescibacterota bacterium]
MRLTTERIEQVTVATIEAEYLDTRNAHELKSALAQLLADEAHLVLDMSHVEFVDSSGLGAILASLRRAAARGGDLKVCAMSKPVRALFELVRMHRIVEILNSRQEAVAAFEATQQPA